MKVGDEIGGNYRLVELKGEGGFGKVFQAEEIWGGRATVAIKVFRNLNEDEFRMLAGLDHPNILRYRTTLRHDNNFCLVTDFADGGDAETLVKSVYKEGLPESEVRTILEGVTDALCYLHGQNIVHRDIKPANILFVNGKVCLGDVGIAKTLETTVGSHTGFHSLHYAAPEMFDGNVYLTSDIYSLGITLFQLLTGAVPFDGPPLKVMRSHIDDHPAYPAELGDQWRLLLQRMLEKDPKTRPSAVELKQLLLRSSASPPQLQDSQTSELTGKLDESSSSAPKSLPDSNSLPSQHFVEGSLSHGKQPKIVLSDAQISRYLAMVESGGKLSSAAVAKLISAAESGSRPDVENTLGDLYLEGVSVRASATNAAKWYRRAAEKGYAEAQFSLGLLYSAGDGVAQDVQEARQWYQKAAQQGHAYARRILR